MKTFIILLASIIFSAVPLTANATEQCTTTELDLMCPDGEMLQGIMPSGTKKCVVVNGLSGLNLYQCPVGQWLGSQRHSSSGGRSRTTAYALPNTCVGQVTTIDHCFEGYTGGNGWNSRTGYRKVSCDPI